VSDPRVRQLAELLVERCLDVQPGWQVTVRSTPLGRPLVDAVARAIGRRGAYALTRLAFGSDRFRVDSEWAREAPLELLAELAPIERYAIEQEDARLTIRAPEAAIISISSSRAWMPCAKVSRSDRKPISRR